MSDESDLGFDERIRGGFQATRLPPAPASLRRALDDLPLSSPPDLSVPRRAAVGLLAAVVAVVAVVALTGLVREGGVGPAPQPSPSPTQTPSSAPTASPSTLSYSAYSVAKAIAGHAGGSIGGEDIIVYGWYSDLRGVAAAPCPTPETSTLDLGCLDRRQGLVDTEANVGSVVGGRWTPTSAAALYPYWPSDILAKPQVAAFIAVASRDPTTPRPIFVLLTGHFDDERAAACPTAASPPCGERFVVDDVFQFDDPAASPPPAPRATPFPSGSFPPPPAAMTRCTTPRAPDAAAPGDPIPTRLASEGWVPKGDVPFPFIGASVAQDTVYFGIVEGDIPLGIWLDDPDGAGRFRWWGTSTCVADANGIWYGWLPGSTYRVFEDGHRVDGGDPFDPQPTPSPT